MQAIHLSTGPLLTFNRLADDFGNDLYITPFNFTPEELAEIPAGAAVFYQVPFTTVSAALEFLQSGQNDI